MLKKIYLTISLVLFLSSLSFAQDVKTNPKTAPPPGNIKLLKNYKHIEKQGIDTWVGEISKPDGMTISYDIGALAGRAAGFHCSVEKTCVWYKNQKANGKDVWIGLRKDGFIIATFTQEYANFYGQTKSPEDIADFLMMILTYGNNEAEVAEKPKSLARQITSKYLFPVSEKDIWGFVNERGEMIIEPQFEDASDFKDGLARVAKLDKFGYKEKYGYINKLGEMVIESQYDEAQDFSEGLALVSKSYRWGFIDTTGKEVIPLQFVEARSFSEGLAAVFSFSQETGDAKWGHINKKGEIVVTPKFSKAYDFSGGVAKVIVGKFGEDKQGFIDTKGDFIIKPQFELAGEFSEDLIPVEIDGKSKKTGEGSYTHISGKYGYVDKMGNLIIQPIYKSADEFSEGLARVKVNEKYGYIDKIGQMVIEPQFEYSSSSYRCNHFQEGLACFEQDDKVGFIDKTGKVVIKPQFTFAKSFVNGFAQVGFPSTDSTDRGYGIIDKTGEVIWKPTK